MCLTLYGIFASECPQALLLVNLKRGEPHEAVEATDEDEEAMLAELAVYYTVYSLEHC